VINTAEAKEFIIKLNRFNQIFIDGETVDGYNIGVYSMLTETLNLGRTFVFEGVAKTKRAGGNLILLDTGYFFKSFKVVVERDGFRITADDSTGKDKPLEKQYGQLVGLSRESKIELVKFIKPLLIQRLRELAKAS